MEANKKVTFDDFVLCGQEDSFIPPGGNLDILLRAK